MKYLTVCDDGIYMHMDDNDKTGEMYHEAESDTTFEELMEIAQDYADRFDIPIRN